MRSKRVWPLDAVIGITDLSSTSTSSPVATTPSAKRCSAKRTTGAAGLVFCGFDISLVEYRWQELDPTEEH